MLAGTRRCGCVQVCEVFAVLSPKRHPRPVVQPAVRRGSGPVRPFHHHTHHISSSCGSIACARLAVLNLEDKANALKHLLWSHDENDRLYHFMPAGACICNLTAMEYVMQSLILHAWFIEIITSHCVTAGRDGKPTLAECQQLLDEKSSVFHASRTPQDVLAQWARLQRHYNDK